MTTIAILLFFAGVLLAVRVMFFGVRREVDATAFRTREWPLAFAAMLGAGGALLYFEIWRAGNVSTGSGIVVLVLSLITGGAARWTVQRSAAAAAASPDPDEDPKYRFQGHVARVIAKVGEKESGRIVFVIDGRSIELAARWLPGTAVTPSDGLVDAEVCIEHVDGDVAFVEPWALVESRL